MHGRIETSRNRSAASAFTLVEMIAVVSIIALLLAIALPAMWKARVNSRRDMSRALILQIESALDMYRDDHKMLPPSDSGLKGRFALCEALTGWQGKSVAGDWNEGYGWRKKIGSDGGTEVFGQVYGPYNGCQNIPTVRASNSAPYAFVDYFDNEIFYWKSNEAAAGITYTDGDNSDSGLTGVTKYATNYGKNTLYRSDYILATKGANQTWNPIWASASALTTPPSDDITNLISE